MSDFDKIINDRLNEEDGEFFPRREANWEKLSERLADFEAANPLPVEQPQPVMRPVWRRWAMTSAAAALVGVSGLLIWHFNEVRHVERENTRLQQEVAALKSNQQQADRDTIVERKIFLQTDTIYRTTTVLNQSELANSANKSAKSPAAASNNRATNTPSVYAPNIEQKTAQADKNRQNAAIVENKLNSNKKELGKKESPKDVLIQKRNNSQLTEMGNNKVPESVPFNKKTEPLNRQKAQLNESIATQTDPSVSPSVLEANKTNIAGNKQNSVTIPPKEGDENLKVDRKNIDNIETVAKNNTSPINETAAVTPPSIVENKDSITKRKTDALAFEKAKQDSIIKANVANQEAKSNAENATPPIIKTNKHWQRFLPKGFAIGAQGIYGSAMPQIPGVEATVGKGIMAELMLTKNISLTAQYDFLKTDFELRERPDRFHLPEAPDPKKPNVGLHHIEGEQSSRLLSLNARYVLSRKWWVQPFVTLGHSWHKIEEHSVNFVFKDITTGDFTPKQAKAEAEKIKSLWQGGVGLEKKIKRFTIMASAEMQKDFSAPTDPSGKSLASNFGILRGGVKFNIF